MFAFVLSAAYCRHHAGECCFVFGNFSLRILEPDQTIPLKSQLSLLMERGFDIRFLAGNNMQQALEYINEINNNLDNTRITRYCSNEAINLILSSYINKAHDADISTQISVTATDFSSYRITDLCSLLANALENAINSCIKQCDNAVSKDNKRLITIKLFEKNNKICINIANTYFKEPRFHNQIPVTDEPDHGIGVRSIISVIEKYNGIYAFFTKDGTFYFQACI